MPTITNRTNGINDDLTPFKHDLIALTNGVDENIFVNEAADEKNLGILKPDVSSLGVTASGSGGTNGTVTIYVVFRNTTLGEDFRSAPSAATLEVIAGNEDDIALTSIPVSADTQVTAREIYWTVPDGDATTGAALVAIISDNTTTTLAATNILTNTGRNLDDAPTIWGGAVIPKV